MNRRTFLKLSAAAGAVVLLPNVAKRSPVHKSNDPGCLVEDVFIDGVSAKIFAFEACEDGWIKCFDAVDENGNHAIDRNRMKVNTRFNTEGKHSLVGPEWAGETYKYTLRGTVKVVLNT